VIIDISPAIHPGIAVFPGDTPFRQDWLMRISAGAHLDLSTMTTTMHIGAHADGPSHYAAGRPGIGERPLELYYGPCELRRAQVGRGQRVSVEAFGAPPRAKRVLIWTGTFPDPDQWVGDFAGLEPELVDWLATHGVRLVGVDTPSVDLADSKELPAHQALARADMAVLEGLVLDHAPEGLYTLSALPLKIPGADAAPLRAALITTG
jgi:arylformamidase